MSFNLAELRRDGSLDITVNVSLSINGKTHERPIKAKRQMSVLQLKEGFKKDLGLTYELKEIHLHLDSVELENTHVLAKYNIRPSSKIIATVKRVVHVSVRPYIGHQKVIRFDVLREARVLDVKNEFARRKQKMGALEWEEKDFILMVRVSALEDDRTIGSYMHPENTGIFLHALFKWKGLAYFNSSEEAGEPDVEPVAEWSDAEDSEPVLGWGGLSVPLNKDDVPPGWAGTSLHKDEPDWESDSDSDPIDAEQEMAKLRLFFEEDGPESDDEKEQVTVEGRADPKPA